MTRDPYRQGMGENDSTWMTFRELAEAVSISPRAAEARARRNIRSGRWAHRTDNDARRTGRVLVPAVDLDAMRQGTPGLAVVVPRHDTRSLAQGTRGGSTDPVIAPLRAALQAAEDHAAAQAADLAQLREGLARRDGELDGLREALRRADLFVAEAGARAEQAAGRTDRERDKADAAEAARDAARDAVAREAARAEAERMARQAAEAGRDIAQAAVQAGERRWEASEALLASRTGGGPLVRALRGLLYRRRP